MNKRGIPEKRVAYLETCFNVFCENGLENTGLKMLADACGVSNANLLYYFGDKDSIITEATAHCMAKVEDDFMEQAPKDMADIKRFLEEVPYWTAKKHGKKYRFMYQQRIFCGRYKALHRIRKEFRADARRPVAGLAAADLYVCTSVRALRAVRGRGLSETADCADRRNAAFDHGKVCGKISC